MEEKSDLELFSEVLERQGEERRSNIRRGIAMAERVEAIAPFSKRTEGAIEMINRFNGGMTRLVNSGISEEQEAAAEKHLTELRISIEALFT